MSDAKADGRPGGRFEIIDAPRPKWADSVGPPVPAVPSSPGREAALRAHLERGLAHAWAVSQGKASGPPPEWPAELRVEGACVSGTNQAEGGR